MIEKKVQHPSAIVLGARKSAEVRENAGDRVMRAELKEERSKAETQRLGGGVDRRGWRRKVTKTYSMK